MTVRWQFLSNEEKKKLEEYDRRMSDLLTQRGKTETLPTVEQEMKRLHQLMDIFIIQLEEKYCPGNCQCRHN